MQTTRRTTGAPQTWRLRVELDDHPGALARVTTRLADRDCNVLALNVFPVAGGVVDEIVVQVAGPVLPADLVEMVRAEGGRHICVTAADVRELVDAPTAALRAATRALTQGPAAPTVVAEAVRTVLAADAVEIVEDTTDHPAAAGRSTGAHQITVDTPEGSALLVRRGWAPFTTVELARAAALSELLAAAGTSPTAPVAMVTTDGAGVVLRVGGPSDAEAVAALHARCTKQTLFSRYHAGGRALPRRWLHRLLCPPRGTTVVATYGADVIAMGQLVTTGAPDIAEISLLVEDGWQRKGVGTALLTHLAGVARASGRAELVGWCLPHDEGLLRTAARAGLPVAVRHEQGMLRVAVRAEAESEVAAGHGGATPDDARQPGESNGGAAG